MADNSTKPKILKQWTKILSSCSCLKPKRPPRLSHFLFKLSDHDHLPPEEQIQEHSRCILMAFHLQHAFPAVLCPQLEVDFRLIYRSSAGTRTKGLFFHPLLRKLYKIIDGLSWTVNYCLLSFEHFSLLWETNSLILDVSYISFFQVISLITNNETLCAILF